MKKSLISLLVVGLMSGCAGPNNQSPVVVEKPVSEKIQLDRAGLNLLIEQHTKTFTKLQPALSTSLSLSKDFVGNYNRLLPDYSPQGMKTLQQSMRIAATALANVQQSGLTVDDKLHLQVNQVIDNYYAGASEFDGGYIDTWGGHLPFIVSQIAGPLIDIPKVLQDQQQINSLQDAQDYLARLQAFAVMVDQVKEKVASDAKNGIILPQKLFPKTLKFLHDFVAPSASQHSLVTSMAARLASSNITDKRQIKTLLIQAENIIETMIYPAYKRVTALMTKLETQAPSGDGIWAQPGGDKFYQHEIQYLGDSTLTPQQIHEIGLSEVKRIGSQMNEILNENGKTQGSVGQRMVALASDPQFLFADSPAGRAELLAYLNQEIDTVMAKAPQLFATMPTMGVTVKRIPKVIEAGAPGGFYTPPALDGSRAGEFSINLRDMTEVPRFSLKTLTYHEAAPGHHFQIALNMEQQGIGLMRQNAQFNAYVEGWALYSELVAMEMGMYEGDSWGNLGRLQAELYRAVRLVVDTGLHYKKWTREQAISYFHTTTGTGLSDVTSEIERYMAWPGQALGYKIGMLKFVELRQTARAALGDKFDIKVFHDLILLKGGRPLSIVEADVNAWIAATK